MTGPLVCAGVLMLVAFSMPGRDGPNDVGGLDVIALVKLGARFVSLAVMAYAVMQAEPRRRNVVFLCLSPFFAFLAWGVVSVGWSALPSISLGQTISLLVLLLLAAVIGMTWHGPEDTSRVLFALSVSLGLVAFFILGVDLLDHDLSGLNRENDEFEEGAGGMVHPTSAGATAALGLMILVGSRILWNWPWTRWMLWPGVVIHLILLLGANSRTASGLVLVSIALALALWAPRLAAGLVLFGCIAGASWLVIDPKLQLFDRTARDTSGYVTRGESTALLLSLTGRTDLWDAIWASFLESPWIGHGYFVTSKNGLLDVWSGPANRSAHNVFLQVMVTTGMVGLLLFLAAWGRLLVPIVQGLQRTSESRRLGAFLGLIGLWYLGWCQMCESFMGPIQPEAVVFFALIGLGLSAVPEAPAPPPQEAGT